MLGGSGTEFAGHCRERVDLTCLPFDRVAADVDAIIAGRTGSHRDAALEHAVDVVRLAIDVDHAAHERTVVTR